MIVYTVLKDYNTYWVKQEAARVKVSDTVEKVIKDKVSDTVEKVIKYYVTNTVEKVTYYRKDH